VASAEPTPPSAASADEARAASRRSLQEKMAQESAIAAFGQRALEQWDVARLGDEAVELIRGVLGAEGCSIFELLPDGRHVMRTHRVGPGAALDSRPVPLADMPLAQHALETGEPLVIEDVASSEYSQSGLVARFGTTSSLNLPIFGKQHPFGVVGVYSAGQRKFSTADIDFIRTIANLYAQALSRDRAEKELRRSEEYYRSLLENVTDVVSVLEPDGTLLFTTSAVEKLLGRASRSVVGVNILRFHDPACVARLRAAYAAAMARPGRPVAVESRVRREDGSWMDCEISVQATTGLTGRPVLISTMRDITERKRIERERSLLALIVESSDDAITARDPNGLVTFCNPAAERAYGYKASEVIGRQRDTFELPEQAAEMRERFAEVIRSGRSQRLETKRRRKDGTLVEVSVNASPLLDPDGTVIGFAAISSDITERKLAERARELARSNAEMEEFAYVAAHDLKEPLRVMGLYAQLLKQRLARTADAETVKFLGYIEDGARRGQALNDALLTYARVAPKAAVLQPVDCFAVLTDVLQDLRAAIEAAKAVISYDPLPTIVADRTLLGHLFQNLISNAIRFRSQAPPQVRIGARRQGSEWLFVVRDNGIGIDAQYQSRIFDMFQRLHPRDEYPGTGVGLSICKKAIEKLGGRIWVESQPGKGSSFFFTIPFIEPQALESRGASGRDHQE
jgi:PAS domain S-box-containing protein